MKSSELEHSIIAVDVVVFRISRGNLEVLLYRRDKEPFKGAPALPGVAILIDETLECAARRALAEKAGWNSSNEIYLEQLAAFDALYRDPRGRTISIAYIGITRIKTENNKKHIWHKVSDLVKGYLPFDHNLIFETALNRLRGKLRYTNIAKVFLPSGFRIEELQEVYEAILGRPLNRTNFRNKLLKIELIKQVSVLTNAVGKKGGRPPHLYRFTQNLVEAEDRDFL